MSGYCRIAPGHPLHGPYHDTEYGFPSADETVLFERLCLEIMQAGLSWELVLKRRDGMRAAFSGFAVDLVAAFGPADEARLLADARIIRNRLKVRAIIENARRVRALRASHGGFSACGLHCAIRSYRTSICIDKHRLRKSGNWDKETI